MNKQDQQDLESLVKNIFRQSKQSHHRSSRSRLKAILGRSLHELAIRDILLFFGHLVYDAQQPAQAAGQQPINSSTEVIVYGFQYIS